MKQRNNWNERKSNNRRVARAAQVAIEGLEGRRLLSVAVEATGIDSVMGLDSLTMAPTEAAAVQEPYNGSPFTIGPESGGTRIELEDYDLGGEGVSFHDTTPTNLGGVYRPDEAVDLKANTDAHAGYRISNVAAGEWTEYTIFVEDGGGYKLEFAASQTKPGGRFHVEVDGAGGTDALTVPDTGDFNRFATVADDDVPLGSGMHVLRVSYDSNAQGSDSVGAFNWLRISPAVAPEQTPYSENDQAHVVYWDSPSGLALEDFDRGGEGIAYHDTTPTNLGGAYRPDEAVDVKAIKGAPAGAFRLSNVAAGEWTEYTIDVFNDYVYTLDFAASQSRSGGKFHAEIDGVNVTGALSVPNTGSFDTFRDVSKSGITLTTGLHVFRVSFDKNATASDSVGGFDKVRFIPTGEVGHFPVTTAAYVRDGADAKTNFGSASELLVKKANGTGTNREAVLKLDLSGFGTIGSAVLQLYGQLSDDTSAAGVQVAAFASTNTSWSEGSVTWNTRPASNGAALATVTVDSAARNLYQFDLTTYLRAQKTAGRNTVTIVLKGLTATSPYVTFNSDDASERGPELVVSI